MPKLIYIFLASVFLLLAIIGAFLPVMPTVPFLLLAAFFASKGSPRLHRWMHEHPRFGTYIKDWEREKAISRQSKIIAVATICGSGVIVYFTLENIVIKAVIIAILIGVIIYLVTRPEPKV